MQNKKYVIFFTFGLHLEISHLLEASTKAFSSGEDAWYSFVRNLEEAAACL